jgi:hypothetical protein
MNGRSGALGLYYITNTATHLIVRLLLLRICCDDRARAEGYEGEILHATTKDFAEQSGFLARL